MPPHHSNTLKHHLQLGPLSLMALHLFNVPFHFPLPPEKPPNRPVKSTGKTRTMARKSLLKPTLLTILTIIILYSFSNTFLFPTPVPPNPPLLSHHSHPFSGDPTVFRHPSPAKIFLYDLPRKFTHGVIESYLAARDSLAKPVDDSKLKYPGNQHSAEWFLFSDLINPNRFDSHVVRVSDPEKADLFYVPFFSSLSLVVNPIRAVDFGSGGIYSDEEMQEGLMEWLEGKVYWKRNLGRDHVFVCQDPNALYRVIDRVKNSVLLVSDFGRLRGDQAGLVKDVILPYSHRINSYNGDVGVEGRNSLLFFMGNRYRKEIAKLNPSFAGVFSKLSDIAHYSKKGCHKTIVDLFAGLGLLAISQGGKIRDLLFQILENQEDVIIKHGAQSRESRRMATQGMHSSKFCLHPAGDTPSACRLFDAIVSLCVPVIVSDHIELPFEDVIDYKKIAIFLDSATAVRPRYLVSMLRELSTERILQYQMELKMVKRYFEYEEPNGTVNEIWRQVSRKLPLIKLMVNRDKRLIRKNMTIPDCSCLCSDQSGSIARTLMTHDVAMQKYT